jgi:hypothetical protein
LGGTADFRRSQGSFFLRDERISHDDQAEINAHRDDQTRGAEMKQLQSLDDIFTKKLFRIPDYQRGYSWGAKQLVEFWEDLVSLNGDRSHYTGVISIKPVPSEVTSLWNDEQWLLQGKQYKAFHVVDGQQRLTTISIFIQCLIEAVETLPASQGVPSSKLYLGHFSIDDIKKTFIVETEPRHETIRTYKFGYEKNNRSAAFLRSRIFNDQTGAHEPETFYTLNLENAKIFFKENIRLLLAAQGLDALETLYDKLTRRFLFNLYEIDENFDVFVAFETMNNRGKKLSNLELLKNRLIYLTTLYDPLEVTADVAEAARRKINDTWGEIYYQLGRNKSLPLDDDEFLHAHWIMYFKYSRNRGSDYIDYLLNDYFSPKNVLEKFVVSTAKLSAIEMQDDGMELEEDDSAPIFVPQMRSKLTIAELNDYVISLNTSACFWFSTFHPADAGHILDLPEKVMMDKVNRIKITYFRPLVMAALLRTNRGDSSRVRLLEGIERFIFLSFRLSRAQANYGSSHFYRLTREVYKRDKGVDEVVNDLNKHLAWVFNKDGVFNSNPFFEFVSKKFATNGQGFYGWGDLRYFLFEYEEDLKKFRGVEKLGWSNFVKSTADRFSIEHVYPQTPDEPYWVNRFSDFSDEQQTRLRGSLGNLLPLSASINSELQNDDFPSKKQTKTDKAGSVKRNGYANGSYSELEVAAKNEWTAHEIKDRGLKLLEFMERRWGFSLGSDENKLKLLHLSFLEPLRANPA